MQQSFLFQTRPEPIREEPERSPDSTEAEAPAEESPVDAAPTPAEAGPPAPAREQPSPPQAPAPSEEPAAAEAPSQEPVAADDALDDLPEDEIATAVPPAADAPREELAAAPPVKEEPAAPPVEEEPVQPEVAEAAPVAPPAEEEPVPAPTSAKEEAPASPAPEKPEEDEEVEPPTEPAPSGTEPPPPGDEEPPGGGGGSLGPGEVSLLSAARQRYLNYALSVITARALPDVRDGVKPVQRRILYAMYANLRLLHTGRFRKSAAVVGEVMARFHPHGDQSIYDAMVRLSQSFSLRAPLVDGHGNFGSLDGDPPAAMRYTECRLRALAAEMVKEIGQDTVPFRPNYDGTTEEPVVLPTRIPNLLVNGVTGIAVGMATNIPPHNLREVCRAAVALIDTPEADTAALLEHMEGPDFPLGGEILNSRAELEQLYRVGRGAIRLRGTYELEKHSRRRWMVITSIPYAQNKATLVEAIGQAIVDGKIPQLIDVRDESTDDIRIVLELKRGASDRVAAAWLYKHTNLRTNFHVNMTVLLPTENPEVGRPEQVGLVEVLRQFNRHRFVVVTRRFEHELARILERLHILRGFAILFDALDEAIAIIRGSEGKKDAAAKLMARFPLDAIQTDAILELKLYRLAKLQIAAVREELERLEAEAARIQAILASEDALWGVVRAELLEVAEEHGDARRTAIGGERDEFVFDANAYIVDRNTWVLVTRGGWIKRQGGFSDLSKVRVREGDSVGWVFRASTRSTLCFLSDRGRAYVLRAEDIPQTSGYGEPVQRHFSFADGEQVVGVFSMDARNLPSYRLPVEEVGLDSIPPDGGVEASSDAEAPNEDEDNEASSDSPADVGPIAVAVTRAGKGLLFPMSKHSEPSTKNGRRFASLDSKFKGKDAVVAVRPLRHAESRLCLATEQGRALVFMAEQLKLLRGTGRGVNAIRLGAGDAVLDWLLSPKRHLGLMVETSRGREVRISERKYGLTRRGGKGTEVIKRGTLKPMLRDPIFIDPLQGGDEPEELSDDDLDALEDEQDG